MSSAIVGRDSEVEAVRAMIRDARAGVAGAALVTGEPGIGKTSLLRTAVDEAGDLRLLRAAGYEVEATLPYGALQRLLLPLVDHVRDLPDAQREAVTVALGLGPGRPPERALVALGTLSLLARAAQDQPLLCVVDDAHHVDAESQEALGIVARRLSAEPLALLFAARDDDAVNRSFAGVPTLRLSGLDVAAATRLLTDALAEELDATVVAAVVARTEGNPLALAELAAHWDAWRLTTSSLAPTPLPIGQRLERHYSGRVARLPVQARRWLLLAAAESAGDASVVRVAARADGLDDDAAAPLEADGLVELHDRVVFRHPLVRSAVYAAATDVERRAAHATLARCTAEHGLREVAAWHAAAAAPGPDASVADELAAVADLAGLRGGLSSRTRLLVRAAELEPRAPRRDELRVAAAESALATGAPLLARGLLAELDPATPDRITRGRARVVRAWCGMFLAEADERRHGVATLADAADDFRAHSPDLEQRALLRAAEFAQTTECVGSTVSLDELGARMRTGAGGPRGPYTSVLGAVASFVLDRYEVAVPHLRAGVAELEALDDGAFVDLGVLPVLPSIGLWDADLASDLLLRTVRVGRERGALREVDGALWALSAVELSRTNPRLAGEYLTQAADLRQLLGYPDEQVVNAAHLAWTGAPAATVEAICAAMRTNALAGVTRMGQAALGIRDLADGDYARAYDRLRELVERPFLQAGFHQIAEFVEAAARSGHDREAGAAADLLDRFAAATGSPWATGMAHRARALLDEDAEEHHLASIRLLDTPGHRGDAARGRLVYGEWLRRARRKGDAQAQLRAAHTTLEAVGAHRFAARAARELAATGVSAPSAPAPDGPLTAQEASVARLAAQGATNTEIASALFISPNTVDYHLRKVFRKLDVTSRRQLGARLPGA